MTTHTYSFERFTVSIEEDVLWGLLLSRLIGRDLRSTRKAVDDLILEFLLESQTHHGQALAQSGPLAFSIRAGRSLQDQCARSVEGIQVRTFLLSRNPDRLAPQIQRLLPRQAGPLESGAQAPDPGSFPRRGLLLVDASATANEPMQAILGLDEVVQRHLVDPAAFANLSPTDQARTVPIEAPKPRAKTLRETRKALLAAVQAARISQVFQRVQARSLRWCVHLETEVGPDGRGIVGVLHFDGTERLLRSQDLNLDLGWGEIPETRLKDVLGSTEVKARFQEHLSWLADPQGNPGLKGALFYGPPGTGKTHLCHALAGEAQVPCVRVSASDFQSMWIGETERAVRETFAALRDQDAAVLVIDELDALAWRRDQTNAWTAQWQSTVMGALLTAIDGLRQGPGRVLLLATTNQIERIDPALLRSHRLAECIFLGHPDREGRREILEGLLRDALDEKSLAELASMTSGMTSADLVQLIEKARKRAGDAGPSLDIFRQAVFLTRAGDQKAGARLSESARRRVAYHEAGHALLTHDLLGPDWLVHLSILPQARGALGALYLAQPDEEGPSDRATVKGRLAMYLAGKAAEALLTTDQGASGGVEQDLAEATRLAQHAITAWGMDDTLPPISFQHLAPSLQDILSARIADRVQTWILEAEATARRHLELHWERLERLAEGVLEAETLHRPDLLKLLAWDPSF